MGPHVLDAISIPLHTLVLMNGAIAVVLCVVLGLNLAIVDPILHLELLKRVLHLLLIGRTVLVLDRRMGTDNDGLHLAL